MSTIREMRQARGWTQFELALKVGVQPQAIYLWETGRRVPQVPQMRRLGEIFELCSDDIDVERANGTERARHRQPHRARADRLPGERSPGRDPTGRAITRPDGTDATDDSGDGDGVEPGAEPR